MPGEIDHPMHSCWRSLFREAESSLLYLVSETVAQGRRHQLTEKTFKPICLRMPFILHSTQGSLEYLRSYGFQTFDTLWDESYDSISNDQDRILAIADLLTYLDSLTVKQQQELYTKSRPIIEHNYEHFYSGNFKRILWQELTDMLGTIDPERPEHLDLTPP